MPLLARAHFLYCPENALGFSTGHLWKAIQHEPFVHKVCEKNEDVPGIYSTQDKKSRYAIAARHRVRELQLRIADDLVCSNEKMTQELSVVHARDRPKVILEKLREQLLRYRQIESDTTDPITTTRKSISGVTDRNGKKDPSAKDDLAFCFTFCVGAMDMLREKRLPLVRSDWLPQL